MAATPAANIQVARVLVDVLAAASAAWVLGTVPKTDLEVVFIFNSLKLIFVGFGDPKQQSRYSNHRVFTHVIQLYIHDAPHS
jgi:hypothetical protein